VKAGKIRFISKYAGMHRIERKSEIELGKDLPCCGFHDMPSGYNGGNIKQTLVQAPRATGLSKLPFIVVADAMCTNWRKGLTTAPLVRTG